MSNAFDFGIGIQATDDGASAVIGDVIGLMQTLENSMVSMASDGGIAAIMGGWDPTALLPAIDTLDGMRQALHDIGGLMVDISGDSEKLAKGLAGTPASMDAAAKDARTMHEEICGVVVCAENIDLALQKAAKSAGNLGQGMSQIPDKAMSAGEHFGRVGAAADMLENSGSKLRHEMVRTYRRMGDTSEAADLMAASVLRTANANMVSVESVSALNTRLAGAAISMGDLTGSAEENLNTMVMMTESYGLTQDQVRDLAGSMKVTGNSLTDLAGVAVQFEKDFRVPGIINTLPEATEAAIAAQGQFGSVVGKSSRDISVNIMRMSGTYARALGVTAAEAANKARTTFMKFTGEVSSFEDIFLGLADDFTPLQTAFLETGISMEDMEDLMRKGATAPGEFAEEVKRIRDSMDPQMGQRFFKQVLRNTDEATQRLLTQENAAAAANEATAGAGAEPENPSAVFNEIAKSMRENAVDAKRMKDALVGAGEELTRLAGDEGVMRGLNNVSGVMQGVNEGLIGTYEEVRKNKEQFEAYTGVIEGATTALVGFNEAGKAFGKIFDISGTLILGVVSGISLLWKPVSFLITKFKEWRALTGSAGTGAAKSAAGVSKFGGAFKFVGKMIGKIALPIAVAIAAFDGIVDAVKGVGDVLSDPSKTGWDKFNGVVMAILHGVWVGIDSFLLGIPQMFVDGFMNIGQRVDTEGSESFGKAVGNILGKGLQLIKDGLLLYWDYLKWFWGTAVPATIKAAFTLEFWGDLISRVSSGFVALGDNILGFFKGIGVGILESFGMTTDSAEAEMDVLAKTFGVVGAQITMFFAEAFSNIIQLAGYAWHGMKEGFFAVRGALFIAGASIADAMAGNFTGIQSVALSVFKVMIDGLKVVADGAIETARAVASALGNVPGMGAISASIIAGIDTAQLAVDDLSSSITGMISGAEEANRARAAASSSATNLIVADLAREDEVRSREFDETLAQYAADKEARGSVITLREEELDAAIRRRDNPTAIAVEAPVSVTPGAPTLGAAVTPGQLVMGAGSALATATVGGGGDVGGASAPVGTGTVLAPTVNAIFRVDPGVNNVFAGMFDYFKSEAGAQDWQGY